MRRSDGRVVSVAVLVGFALVAACGSGSKSEPQKPDDPTAPADGGQGGRRDLDSGSNAADAGDGADAGAGADAGNTSAPGTAGAAGEAMGGSSFGGTGSGGGGTSATNGGAGGAGIGGSGGSAPPPAVRSNLPGASIAVTRMANAEQLILRSSNLEQDSSSSLIYAQWFAEVENTGAVPACHTQFSVRFETAAGQVLLSLDGFADADPYRTSLTTTVACIGPGKTGVLWSNDLPPAVIPTAEIAAIHVTLLAQRYSGAVEHPARPALSSAAITPYSLVTSGDYWSISGRFRSSSTIYNLGLDGYPVSAAGLVVDTLLDHHLETFLAGDEWAFETNAYRGPEPTRFHLFLSFIEGTRPLLDQRGDGTEAPEVRLERDRQKLRSERGDRARALRAARRSVAVPAPLLR